MVQLSSLFSYLLSKIKSKKQVKDSEVSVGRLAANELADLAKKNQLMLTSSGDVGSRNCENFAAAYSKRGKKGLNQDSLVVWEEFGLKEDAIFCGVFDGHGPWGHHVAKTVRKLMPSTLLWNWKESLASAAIPDINDLCLSPESKNVMFDMWHRCYSKTCSVVDQELENQHKIDTFYSGSTALALVRQGDLMIVANVGDSRAVLATTSDDGQLVATQLTNDLKPNLPHESKRIAQSRGRVYSCPDEPGVHRVWMPNGKSVKGPGLAISRSFGDYFIKDFGLISEPEITQTSISSRDEFVILATDGLWDVISNQEAVEIVASTRAREESAKRLVNCAVYAWKHKGSAKAMDDISVICVFFHRLGET